MESDSAMDLDNPRGRVVEPTTPNNFYFKMVFVVNSSLNMSPGKLAAQVGHAAIDLYQEMLNKGGSTVSGSDQDLPLDIQMAQWNENGAKKVVLRSESVAEMVELGSTAGALNLPFSQIQDAGLTEIEPGSFTVLAIFGPSNVVDMVTGHLKLL